MIGELPGQTHPMEREVCHHVISILTDGQESDDEQPKFESGRGWFPPQTNGTCIMDMADRTFDQCMHHGPLGKSV